MRLWVIPHHCHYKWNRSWSRNQEKTKQSFCPNLEGQKETVLQRTWREKLLARRRNYQSQTLKRKTEKINSGYQHSTKKQNLFWHIEQQANSLADIFGNHLPDRNAQRGFLFDQRQLVQIADSIKNGPNRSVFIDPPSQNDRRRPEESSLIPRRALTWARNFG